MVKKVCLFNFRRGVNVLHFVCLSTQKIFFLKGTCQCFAYLLGGQKKPLQSPLFKLNSLRQSWLQSEIMFCLCDPPATALHTSTNHLSGLIAFDPALEEVVRQTVLLHSRQGTLVGVKKLGLLRLKLNLSFPLTGRQACLISTWFMKMIVAA